MTEHRVSLRVARQGVRRRVIVGVAASLIVVGVSIAGDGNDVDADTSPDIMVRDRRASEPVLYAVERPCTEDELIVSVKFEGELTHRCIHIDTIKGDE